MCARVYQRQAVSVRFTVLSEIDRREARAVSMLRYANATREPAMLHCRRLVSSSRGALPAAGRSCALLQPRACMLSSPTTQRLLSTAAKPPADDEKKPSRWQQMKTMFREHGPVFVGYYATTWLGGFGVCWAGVSVAGLDGVALLQYLGADAVIDTRTLSPQLINALIAAEINELADFVRLPLVIATTPALSRRLKALRGGAGAGPGAS